MERASAQASATVLFIFQFPAITGILIGSPHSYHKMRAEGRLEERKLACGLLLYSGIYETLQKAAGKLLHSKGFASRKNYFALAVSAAFSGSPCRSFIV